MYLHEGIDIKGVCLLCPGHFSMLSHVPMALVCSLLIIMQSFEARQRGISS